MQPRSAAFSARIVGFCSTGKVNEVACAGLVPSALMHQLWQIKPVTYAATKAIWTLTLTPFASAPYRTSSIHMRTSGECIRLRT